LHFVYWSLELQVGIAAIIVIIFPLIFSSLERIDMISNAMELRGFGKQNKRTWYSERAFQIADHIIIASILLFSILAMVITFYVGSRFYNPFLQHSIQGTDSLHRIFNVRGPVQVYKLYILLPDIHFYRTLSKYK